jgi:hypothetical protein
MRLQVQALNPVETGLRLPPFFPHPRSPSLHTAAETRYWPLYTGSCDNARADPFSVEDCRLKIGLPTAHTCRGNPSSSSSSFDSSSSAAVAWEGGTQRGAGGVLRLQRLLGLGAASEATALQRGGWLASG